MIESFIVFPVHLEIKNQEKSIISIYKGWKELTSSVPLDGCNHHGRVTGARNNITVLDIVFDKELSEQMDNLKTYNVTTPSGNTHFYFLYEEKLKSIYNTLPCISVINDNNCVFFGLNYAVLNQKPIIKMPDDLFDTLYDAQMNRDEEVIDHELYDLFSMLGYKWFNNHDYTMQIIHALRNENITMKILNLATITRLMDERSYNYHERSFMRFYDLSMNSKEQRFGLCALKKIIKRHYPIEYEDWRIKWDPKAKKTTAKLNLIYKQGGLVKMSEVKAACGNIKATKLLEINSEFTVTKVNICKSCLNKHKTHCCDKYKRDSRTTCMFVNNIELV